MTGEEGIPEIRKRLRLVNPCELASYAQKNGADERTRTADLLITSELLYLLSYVGAVFAILDYTSKVLLA